MPRLIIQRTVSIFFSLNGSLTRLPQLTNLRRKIERDPKSGYLGVAMRTQQRRYVEWTKLGETPVSELYDVVNDPQNDFNLAGKPEHAETIAALSKQLRKSFPSKASSQPESR